MTLDRGSRLLRFRRQLTAVIWRFDRHRPPAAFTSSGKFWTMMMRLEDEFGAALAAVAAPGVSSGGR